MTKSNLRKEILEILEEVWINGFVQGKGNGETRLEFNKTTGVYKLVAYPSAINGKEYMNGKITKIIEVLNDQN